MKYLVGYLLVILLACNSCVQSGKNGEYPPDSMEYPSRITHIWFTAFGYERGFPQSVVLRMYWDGTYQPT